ncbi:MAG TPA: PQQ-dependent sugar dehydrogenase [Burkholderiales bacterium]
MKTYRIALPLLAALVLPFASASAQDGRTYRSELESFRVVTIARGLDHPWSLAFLPDGRKLVTERAGRLRIIGADGKLQPDAVQGVPKVVARGQGGLLDVALHPRFAQNALIYLSYAEAGEGGQGTAVMRARLVGDGGNAHLEDQRVIFRLMPKSGTTHHFGGRLVFDRDEHLYITLGDRGEMERAQKLDDHAGSVIRINDDGSVPKDNPFVNKPNAKPEIYTYGNRNVQGAALHPQSGVLWTHEHGPQGGDEINVMHAGVNYGWPVITYGVNYVIGTKIGEGTHKAGMAQPIYQWTPSIAPSGMAFYTGDKFPQWRGNLFVGALKFKLLVRLELDGERVVKEERLLEDEVGRIRDVRAGPDGYIYVLTDESDGEVLRLEPTKQ